MYKLNYFQKELNNKDSISLQMYMELLSENQIIQPKIFCDKYYFDPLKNLPVFHTYFINQHYDNCIILTDYDQLDYIKDFGGNFLVVYDSDKQSIKEYKDKYKFIEKNTNIIQYMKENNNAQL